MVIVKTVWSGACFVLSMVLAFLFLMGLLMSFPSPDVALIVISSMVMLVWGALLSAKMCKWNATKLRFHYQMMKETDDQESISEL